MGMETAKAGLQGIEKEAHGRHLSDCKRLKAWCNVLSRLRSAVRPPDLPLMPATLLRRHQGGLPRLKIP